MIFSQRTLGVALLIALSAACTSDNGLSTHPIGHVAVAAGDFDDVADPLDRVPVAYATYEGIISAAAWDPTWDPEQVPLKVEGLFTPGQLNRFETVFVASGVRGLGGRQYNSLERDDHLVSDPAVIDAVRTYVQNGRRTLFVTDWAYDLVEAAWPGAIDFLGDDIVYDDAQRGEIGELTADVVHDGLAGALGTDAMALSYDFSNWAVIEGVGEDTTVYLTADATYRVPSETGDTFETQVAAPMLVSFQPPGATGRVVYASFHVDAQSAGAIDQLLTAVVGELREADVVTETY